MVAIAIELDELDILSAGQDKRKARERAAYSFALVKDPIRVRRDAHLVGSIVIIRTVVVPIRETSVRVRICSDCPT